MTEAVSAAAAGARSRALPRWAEAVFAAGVLPTSMAWIYASMAARAGGVGMPVPGWMDTALDRALPTLPVAVWVYVSWYPAMLLLALAGRATVRRAYVSLLLAFLTCSLGHLLLPVAIARPAFDGSSDISDRLLTWLYAVDPPRNLFPSFHAAGAGILVAMRSRGTAGGWLVAMWALAVCGSCVLIRQHYVVDVVVGFPIGVGAAALAARMLARAPR